MRNWGNPAKENKRVENSTKKNINWKLVIIGVVVIVIIVVIFIFQQVRKTPSDNVEVITVSTLEKIINVSELSTFTAVYNGIAEVENEKKPEEIDYYVSYEAKVNAGIDFEKILIEIDNETKEIIITTPNVYITDVNVDISSLDFIFYNDKANTSTVTQQAFKACEEDVNKESEQQTAIFDLAQQNAINILTALTQPIVEQLDADYTLVVEQGGV